ncbi:hypothetical protein SAMN02746095_03848 [Acidocella aminolytica 101 = DSM 11237]|uniref:Uncharacterized protein n=1 Tax=Acidocella aminolytica 101 = DSM 11237 TaxID=1120923 RepID=A0A0D6PG56_9PROT|nr:hypothetical protein Aam_046_002 [Acidocella aminolytica 101 = DSM 11237]GBQ37392.1 hypothetical protein AA11237_1514 [Acidocella aminolytica 101 = DSM 11237]SHF60653.1 hypothetical protein SAMN02746095_03848 [Acidocella aminolytica 101 = DSM 11237]
MVNHPNRSRRDRPGDRLQGLGATVLRTPDQSELPNLVAMIVRLWGELHTADPALARELARKLPAAEIRHE